jgi:hypothetical protein
MRTTLGAVTVAASFSGSKYSARTTTTTAQSKGRGEGRREVLSQVITFGPNRLREMSLELGFRFTKPEDEYEDGERELG